MGSDGSWAEQQERRGSNGTTEQKSIRVGLNRVFGLIKIVLCSKHAMKYHLISIQNCHIHKKSQR